MNWNIPSAVGEKISRASNHANMLLQLCSRRGWSILKATVSAPGWPPVEATMDARDHWMRGIFQLSQGPVPSQPPAETPPNL